MTVIRRPVRTYSYPNPTPNQSDTEVNSEAYSGSDSEVSTHERETPAERRRNRRVLRDNQKCLEDNCAPLKKSCGKKKLRRYENTTTLQSLHEEDEEEKIQVVLMEPHKTPFDRLLESNDHLSYWNYFIEQDEEEQMKLIESFSKKCKCTEQEKSTHEKPFKKISYRLRRILKIKKNLPVEVIRDMEEEMIQFFNSTPDKVLVTFPRGGFERLLCHAVAQYHGLCSLSDKQSVQTYYQLTKWKPAECLLTDFVIRMKQ